MTIGSSIFKKGKNAAISEQVFRNDNNAASIASRER
jgi:hypothetical protein